MARGDKAQTYDKERVQLNIARLRKGGYIFEIDVDPDMAIKFREGADVDVRDVLKAQKIFFDVMKGNIASDTAMGQLFKTAEPNEVAKIILKEGDIQFTAKYRQELRIAKEKKIINMIHRNGVDPRTNAPLPITRIENALQQAKIKVNEFKTADEQVQEILKRLRPIVPIRFEVKEIQLHVGTHYANQVYGIIKQFGKILQANWGNDGSLGCTVEIPGGLEEEFFDKVNSITHGEIESKINKVR